MEVSPFFARLITNQATELVVLLDALTEEDKIREAQDVEFTTVTGADVDTIRITDYSKSLKEEQ